MPLSLILFKQFQNVFLVGVLAESGSVCTLQEIIMRIGWGCLEIPEFKICVKDISLGFYAHRNAHFSIQLI